MKARASAHNVVRLGASVLLLAAALIDRSAIAGLPCRYRFSGSVSLVSNYVFRGITQTDGNPALQASAEFGQRYGLYAGAWGSNISWFSDGNPKSSVSMEIDLYLGWRHSLGQNWNVEVGLYRYQYPGSYGKLSGVVEPNTTEAYAGIGWKWLSFKGSYSLTNIFGVPDSGGTSYLLLSATVPFADHWLLNAHVGRQIYQGRNYALDVSNSDLYSYTDYEVSVTRKLSNGVSVTAAVTHANANRSGYTVRGKYLAANWFILSVKKTL